MNRVGVIDDAVKTLVLGTLRQFGEENNARDLGLVACGAKPVCLITTSDAATIELVAELERRGLHAQRWPNPPNPGLSIVVGHDRDRVAQTVQVQQAIEKDTRKAIRAGRDTGPGLRDPALDERLGLLLGYPSLSVRALVEHRPSLVERHWSRDERRFLMCSHGAAPEEESQARMWIDSLLAAFLAAYGREIVDLLPVVEFGGGET
jgi:hypothetical protein